MQGRRSWWLTLDIILLSVIFMSLYQLICCIIFGYLNIKIKFLISVASLLQTPLPSMRMLHFLFFSGQIEVFTWSASGTIITEALASSCPTIVVYVMDTVRSVAPVTFMSNMLYACSILYKTRLPFIVVMNKVRDIIIAEQCYYPSLRAPLHVLAVSVTEWTIARKVTLSSFLTNFDKSTNHF